MNLTHRELEALAGHAITAKAVLCFLGDRAFRREEDGSWAQYPESAGSRARRLGT